MAKPRAYRPSFLIALGVMAISVGIYTLVSPTILTKGELALYDQQFRMRGPRPGGDQVVIVTVDDKSLKAVGHWPWPRDVLAQLVTRLTEAGAAAVAFDIIFAEPERSGELKAATRLTQRLPAQAIPQIVRTELENIIRDADHDSQLAEAIRANDRVILATAFTSLDLLSPGAPPERKGQPLKSAVLRVKDPDQDPKQRGLFPPTHAEGVTLPIPPLLASTQALGHVNMQPDFDGVTRWEALIVEHHGYYYPSLALEAVRIAAGLEPLALRLHLGDAVVIGDVTIPIDGWARVLIDYSGEGKSFRHISASDVLAQRIPAEQLKDRIVFIGATAEGLYDLRVTPFSPVLPGVEKHANMAANILEGRFIVRPAWVEIVELGTTIAFPILLGLLLPRLRPMTSLAAALALQVALLATTHVAFRRGLWLPAVYPSVSIGLTFIAITVYRFFTEERQRLFTKRAFQQYVSPAVVERIVADPSALQFGGEVRNLTVMFCDIRDFTTFAERNEPQVVVTMLREHLTRLTSCIMDEEGTLDKYIGDAIMAIFGAPITLPDHAERACRAALRMTEEAKALRAKWESEGKEPLRIGIGVNTADMVVGNLGSEQVFSYTVTGDGVNLGARLESLNKDYKTSKQIIISEYTYEAAKDVIETIPLGEVLVKGKTRPVAIYELTGMKSSVGGAPTEPLTEARAV